ncbi:HAMP domain-containing histidine kinase [Oscillatoria sp. FACHB-1406]|nr:HAMP domain-containing histidine kinase [Oscillatoria sp. FACHB-1406]
MFESDGLLLALSQIIEQEESSSGQSYASSVAASEMLGTSAAQRKAEAQWRCAIVALERLLMPIAEATRADSCQGLILSAPSPISSQPAIAERFQCGTFTREAFSTLLRQQFQLPAAEPQTFSSPSPAQRAMEYPLFPVDPLASEQFCLVLTAKFSLVMVLGENSNNQPTFQFSFNPETVDRAWATLRSRLCLTVPYHLPALEAIVQKFAPRHPDYRLVADFARHLLEQCPDTTPSGTKKTVILAASPEDESQTIILESDSLPELQLLQALTHEVRTPLTTIRMLARLLLKQRSNLAPEAVERLETIDRECSEQIDRMELIFRAAELETTPCDRQNLQLVPISLDRVIQQNIPHWQKQAKRRSIDLEIILPEKLPTIVSNPAMLDQVLRGVMESFTRNLPPGSRMQVQVMTAGHQLKLQLLSRDASLSNSLKSLGQLLVFQPETGSLTLNWDVTKNLFNALGGKLLLRQRPQQGEELTVFLPLGNAQSEFSAGMFGKKGKAKKESRSEIQSRF